MIDKEEALQRLKLALETNRYVIYGTKVTVLPTEFAIKLYNFLSEKEKLFVGE